MKQLLAAVLLFAAASAVASEDITSVYNVPRELFDCRIYQVTSAKFLGPSSFIVVRCPNSSTDVQEQVGKQTRRTIVLDNVKYIESN